MSTQTEEEFNMYLNLDYKSPVDVGTECFESSVDENCRGLIDLLAAVRKINGYEHIDRKTVWQWTLKTNCGNHT